MTDLDNAQKAADEARASGSFSNFGRVELQVVAYKLWKEYEDGTRYAEETTKEVWEQSKDRFTEILFTVYVSEINTELAFNYERKVSILGGKKSDWAKTVRPSIDEVFGKDATLSEINGRYVEVVDVPQQNDADWDTIKFIRQFATREECVKAWQEKSGKTEFATPAPVATAPVSATATQTAVQQPVTQTQPAYACPPNYAEPDWTNMMVPALKGELAAGKTYAQIEKEYGIPVQFIVPLKG